MKNLINAFSLVAMLVVFTSCGGNLTNSVYSYEDDHGKLYAIKFYENEKFVFVDINSRYVDDKSPLYMCYCNSKNAEQAKYRKDGKSIKILKGNIVKDEMIFEGGIIKWKGVEFKLDKRFSTIKKQGKYSGTVYVTNYGSEDAVVFVFINESKLMYIENMKKTIRDYEIEDGKLIIPEENIVLDEGKDKLIFNSSWGSYIFKKHDQELDDFEFFGYGVFGADLKWKR